MELMGFFCILFFYPAPLLFDISTESTLGNSHERDYSFCTSFFSLCDVCMGMFCDCAIVSLFFCWRRQTSMDKSLCTSGSQHSVTDQPIYRARCEKSAAEVNAGLLGRGKALKGGVEIYI